VKICTVVGARPQFIKAAALSRILRNEHHEILLHTGQHYDRNMSDVFFEELSIPMPDYNLGIAGGGHGAMTGRMLIAIEEVLQKESPDMVLVYGDTNSTLAGALVSVKLHIPVCHVEAGVRMGTLLNPEEVNRVLTDRISQLLMCCTNTAINNLKSEGVTRGVYNTGDLMYDAVLYYGQRMSAPHKGEIIGFDGVPILPPHNFYYFTCHRQENTADETLRELFSALQVLDAPVIYPVHPRNRERALRLQAKYGFTNVTLVQPVSYLTSLYLAKNACRVITDSGGLQREAWFFGVPCVTVLNQVVWPETLDGNMNQISSPNKEELLQRLRVMPDQSKSGNPFGDGHAAEKITQLISQYEREQ